MESILKFLLFTYRRLSNIIRFNTTPKVINETVAAHSYFVALCSLLLYYYYNINNIKSLNKILIMALIHDLEESYSGDIIAYLKRSRNFREMLNKESELFLDASLLLLSVDIKDDLIQCWKEFRENKTQEARIVKISDYVTGLIWSLMETEMGNKHTNQIISNYILLLKKEKAPEEMISFFVKAAQKNSVVLKNKFLFGMEEEE